MELRQAFLIFTQYIKSHVPNTINVHIEKLEKLLALSNNDNEIKSFILSLAPTHQRVSSQSIPQKIPQQVKQNSNIGTVAFVAKPKQIISTTTITPEQTAIKKLVNNLEIQIKKTQKPDFGKFTQKVDVLNDLLLCISKFQQNTETLYHIYNYTSEIQTAYGIRVSQDIRTSESRKNQNPLFLGYNSKLMSDDQLLAIQNNFLVKKQIVKAKDFVYESPLLQQNQIFLQ